MDPLANDAFAASVGIELVAARPGHAQTRLEIGASHRNALGLVHGGVLFTLGATAFFAGCNAGGETGVGVNLNITFLRPVEEGLLMAEATQLSRSRRLAHYEVRVVDGEGVLVATLTGTASIRGA